MIVIASDHRGLKLKQQFVDYFKKTNIEVLDEGTFSQERVDACLFAKKATQDIVSKKAELGILICGTGIAMCITANRVKGIRAVQLDNKKLAIRAKQHNNANVVCFGADIVSFNKAKKYFEAFDKAKFLGGIYEKRNQLIDEL